MTTRDWLPLAITLFFNITTIAIPLGTRLVDLNTDVALLRERLENVNHKVKELNDQLKHDSPARFTRPTP